MYISPMLLDKSKIASSGPHIYCELKFDGIRLLLSKFEGKVRTYTRHNNEATFRFKELQNVNIDDGTVLDGEIIVAGQDGKPDFELMMERFHFSKSLHEVQYCVFDLLYYKHENMMKKPLRERKKILEKILPTNQHIVYVQHIEGRGVEYFNSIKEYGLEGIVQKDPDSIYVPGKRSKDWIKVINYQYEKVILQGIRKNKFGVLLSFEDGSPAGIMEFMKPNDRKKLYAEYRKYIRTETDDFIYLFRPKIKRYSQISQPYKKRVLTYSLF